MGLHYYLAKKGNNSRLEKILEDKYNTLEKIDNFTMQFANLEHLRSHLYYNGYIDSNDELVIVNNKTDKETKLKRLVPIFKKTLIFKEDLELLGFEGRTYNEIAKELWKYIKKLQNDRRFMHFVMDDYVTKYGDSDKKSKAPIYRSGAITGLMDCLIDEKYAERNKELYPIWFSNFFRNEIFKCKMVLRDYSFDGRTSEPIEIFEPINYIATSKPLHDMLATVIEYEKYYALVDAKETIKKEDNDAFRLVDTDSLENTPELRDYQYMLKLYIEEQKIDINDEETVRNDLYIQSILLELENLGYEDPQLSKKYGME